ncbi:MAG: sel1 repeat family protein, partial [Neisseriaceae bacterium]|nr:sel1 repeat family protein [Neisseriaceae bacterium]
DVNYAQAKIYLEKAALQGSSLAQYNLAMIYLNGLGEPVNKEKAREYLQQAAKQGDIDAQKQLELLK